MQQQIEKLTTIPEFSNQSDYFVLWVKNFVKIRVSELVVGSGEQDIDPFCSPVQLWIKNWEKVGFIISELVVGSGEQDNIILFIHFGL